MMGYNHAGIREEKLLKEIQRRIDTRIIRISRYPDARLDFSSRDYGDPDFWYLSWMIAGDTPYIEEQRCNINGKGIILSDHVCEQIVEMSLEYATMLKLEQ